MCESVDQTLCKSNGTCSSNRKYDCDYVLSYMVNDEEFLINKNSIERSKLKVEDMMEIEVDPLNPRVSRKPIPYNVILIVLLIILFFAIVSGLIAYLMSRSRLGRQIHATMTAYDFVKNK